ncbi:MAG: endonuclease/exonuclease/phosphatase family protein [Myxococcales bacterium]|nr:endonuclease/exonuclease/phosphatase family protein [Myxococcales bacterium]
MPLTIATFNVKNLLAPDSDAERALLPAKLDAIAASLRACDADVVGLQEIGPPELLEAVRTRLGPGYVPSVLGTADARGIRCALLSRLPVSAAEVHEARALPFPRFFSGDAPPYGARLPLRRGVVHAVVEAPGVGSTDIFVVHFKSPRPVPELGEDGLPLPALSALARGEGTVRSLVWRTAEALFVRGLVDQVHERRRDPAALASPAAPGSVPRVAVVGDMNDTPDSVVLRLLRGDGPAAVLDCTDRVPPASRFTMRHDGRPIQLDHVLATAELHARIESVRFRNDDLREHPPPDASGHEPPSSDSDHAPVVVAFR